MDNFELSVPPTLYFGERWDAPMLDENVQQIDAPVGRSCMYCEEPIAAEDRGLMRLAVRTGRDGALIGTLEPAHMECDLRTMIGDVAHLEGRCRCSGGTPEPFAGTYREESLAVLAHMNQLRAASGMGPM